MRLLSAKPASSSTILFVFLVLLFASQKQRLMAYAYFSTIRIVIYAYFWTLGEKHLVILERKKAATPETDSEVAAF